MIVRIASTRNAQIFIILMFAITICTIGVVQTLKELSEGESPQALDVLKRFPTEKNLREFEVRLEDNGEVANFLRPWAQYGQFVLLRDAGEKALAGREGWLFYRPTFRYLTQRASTSSPQATLSDPLPAIVSFNRQLESHGIHLIVLPAPNKISVHSEMLTRRVDSHQMTVSHRTRRLIDQLRAQGIDVVDLFEVFHQAKQTGRKLYLARDTHWSPPAVKLAAQEVAKRVRELGLIEQGKARYERHPVTVERFGDLAEMMQSPQIERLLGPEQFVSEQVVEIGSQALREGNPQAEILVLGDSYLRIFEQDEPTAAGFISQLACELQQPVASIINDGGGATLVRQDLARRPDLLKNKKLIVWEFVERDIGDATEGWQEVTLPPAL